MSLQLAKLLLLIAVYLPNNKKNTKGNNNKLQLHLRCNSPAFLQSLFARICFSFWGHAIVYANNKNCYCCCCYCSIVCIANKSRQAKAKSARLDQVEQSEESERLKTLLFIHLYLLLWWLLLLVVFRYWNHVTKLISESICCKKLTSS